MEFLHLFGLTVLGWMKMRKREEEWRETILHDLFSEILESRPEQVFHAFYITMCDVRA